MTLIEVVGGMGLLATLLVAVLLAKGRYTHQAAIADRRVLAVRGGGCVADRLASRRRACRAAGPESFLAILDFPGGRSAWSTPRSTRWTLTLSASRSSTIAPMRFQIRF